MVRGCVVVGQAELIVADTGKACRLQDRQGAGGEEDAKPVRGLVRTLAGGCRVVQQQPDHRGDAQRLGPGVAVGIPVASSAPAWSRSRPMVVVVHSGSTTGRATLATGFRPVRSCAAQ